MFFQRKGRLLIVGGVSHTLALSHRQRWATKDQCSHPPTWKQLVWITTNIYWQRSVFTETLIICWHTWIGHFPPVSLCWRLLLLKPKVAINCHSCSSVLVNTFSLLLFDTIKALNHTHIMDHTIISQTYFHWCKNTSFSLTRRHHRNSRNTQQTGVSSLRK